MQKNGGYGFWLRHIEDCRVSGVGEKEYCHKHGLNFSAFARIRNRINREGKANNGGDLSLIPVTVNAASVESNRCTNRKTENMARASVEIRLLNGRSIAMADVSDETTLGRLIRFLEALPC